MGRSSLALNLAVAMGRLQQQVLLVDADPAPGHLALLAGIESTPAALQSGVLQTCPVTAGVDLLQVYPASDDPFSETVDLDIPDLAEFEAQYQWLIIDTGAGIDTRSLAAARAADVAWVVLTPELTAVADGYAMVKRLLSLEPEHCLGCLVNAAEDVQEAADVQEGFRDLVGRFLGAQIDIRGYIPLDRTVREAAKGQSPFCLASPSTPAAVAVADLASELTERHPIVTLHRHRAYLEGVASLASAAATCSRSMSPAQEPSLIT